MTLWAVIPIKPFARGKSRLSDALSDEDRAALNRCLLENTIDVLSTVPEIEHVLVTSRDPQALALARSRGARTLLENSRFDLNMALERATDVVKRYNALGIMIVPADLPMIDAQDIRKIAAAYTTTTPPVVAIAPDRHIKGTNTLLVCPAGLIRYSFGGDSFSVHCEAARNAGARLEIFQLPSIEVDIDTPADLEYVAKKIREAANEQEIIPYHVYKNSI